MQMGKALAAMNFYSAAGAMRLSGKGRQALGTRRTGCQRQSFRGPVFGSMLCARVNHELTNALL